MLFVGALRSCSGRCRLWAQLLPWYALCTIHSLVHDSMDSSLCTVLEPGLVVFDASKPCQLHMLRLQAAVGCRFVQYGPAATPVRGNRLRATICLLSVYPMLEDRPRQFAFTPLLSMQRFGVFGDLGDTANSSTVPGPPPCSRPGLHIEHGRTSLMLVSCMRPLFWCQHTTMRMACRFNQLGLPYIHPHCSHGLPVACTSFERADTGACAPGLPCT